MRLKKLAISDEFLLEFLKAPAPPGIASEGMPKDARIVGCERGDRTVVLIIESDEFDEVPYTVDIPYLILLFKREYEVAV